MDDPVAEVLSKDIRCIRIEESRAMPSGWIVDLQVADVFSVVGIRVNRTTSGQWSISLPPGVRINDPGLLAAIRDHALEARHSAVFQMRLSYLKAKQGGTSQAE